MKTNFKNFIVLIIIIFTSCSKSDDKISEQDSVVKDVYVVGYEYINGVSRAKYWKNGTEVYLTDGTKEAQANSIFVVGSDIYVAGYEVDNAYKIAKYWKNGVPVTLSNDAGNCNANSIFVVGSDVYVVGYYKDSLKEGVPSAAYHPVLWKNGIISFLPDGYVYSNNPEFGLTGMAKSIYVNSNNDVYIAGTVFGELGALWKNNSVTQLTRKYQSSDSMYLNFIYNKDNNVFLCGSERGSVNGNFTGGATYWKNGIPVLLSSTSIYSDALSMTISGSDTYVAGYDYNNFNKRAVYWKNGMQNYLNTDSSVNALYSEATSIIYRNNDLYIAFYENDLSDYSKSTVKYWKNGITTVLGKGFAKNMFLN